MEFTGLSLILISVSFDLQTTEARDLLPFAALLDIDLHSSFQKNFSPAEEQFFGKDAGTRLGRAADDFARGHW